ncbi:MAG TPA: SCO family protein [Candidatus Udaeobacter sp.]|jgi:protein SCO1/2|nr:SCO family protein [Candidatus Udaeobacter sp.]
MKTSALLLLPVLLLMREMSALTPQDLRQITFDQNVNQQISRDLSFRDSDGTTFQVGTHFGKRPTLLVLGYYHCPMLCTLINNGLIEALQELRLDVGKDFDVINISVDPHETPALAAAKKAEYLKRYGRSNAENGWHFLTGDKTSIEEIAREAGFHFAYDPASGEYAHPSGAIVLTPQGKISRYFLGINISPGELRQAILAAATDQTGSVIQRLVLLCYHYNPITGKYGGVIMLLLRASGIATVLAVIACVVFMSTRRPASARHLSP